MSIPIASRLCVSMLALAVVELANSSTGLANGVDPVGRISAQVIPDIRSTTWVNLIPSGIPPEARGQASAVYDPISDDMTVFGGCGAVLPCLNDVWVLRNADGHSASTWLQLNPIGGPPSGRGLQTSVYDPGTNSMIMFGGNPNEGGCIGAANDTWVLTGANGFGMPTWIQLTPSGTLPGARDGHSAVYDVTTNRMIVFGGADACGAYYNDVWVLSNANGVGGMPTWTRLAVSGTPPAARALHSAVYDPDTNRMIVFGGVNTTATFDDVWVLTDANGLAVGGSPHWTQLSTTGSPGARYGHTAVYDAATNRMTIFGGYSGAITNDTWVLSQANGKGPAPTWSTLTPTGGPPPVREQHTAAFYNPARHRMIVFSGNGGGILYNDVWVLTNTP